MTISNIVLRGLKKTTAVLEKDNLRCCLFGGLAMQVYKSIRSTKDVDLMVAVDSDDILRLITKEELSR